MISPEHGRGGLQRDVGHDGDEERERDEQGQRDRLVALEAGQLLGHELLDVLGQTVHDLLRRGRVLDQLAEVVHGGYERVIGPKRGRK